MAKTPNPRPEGAQKPEYKAAPPPQKEKTFLECMFADLDDITGGSEEEVKAELIELGIDADKALARLKYKIAKLKSEKALFPRKTEV
jgi:hypothetical protein